MRLATGWRRYQNRVTYGIYLMLVRFSQTAGQVVRLLGTPNVLYAHPKWTGSRQRVCCGGGMLLVVALTATG
jgi:hypothetical protein